MFLKSKRLDILKSRKFRRNIVQDQQNHLINQNSIQKDEYSHSKHSKFATQRLLKDSDQSSHLISQNSIQLKDKYSYSKHSKFAMQRLLKDSDQPSHLVSQNSIQLKDRYSHSDSKHSKFVMQKLLKSNQDLYSHNVQVVQDMLNQASKEIRKNLQRQDELHKVVLLHSEKHQLHKRV
mgnify:CR=1 FL=1